MSKVLVIKGANFGDNAVTTITFDEEIPCTGIEFSSDTVTINGYESQTISYTVTPEDTTDAVTWSTSNENVVTVNNGVLNVVGIGSCTVTAICGNQSASATVTVSIGYIENYVFGNINSTPAGDTLAFGTSAANRISALGSGRQEPDYKLANSSGVTGDNYPILLPKNTGRVKISATDNTKFYDSDSVIVNWCKNEASTGTLAGYIKFYENAGTFNFHTSVNPSITLDVPQGVDVMTFSARMINVKTLTAAEVAEGAGIEIEFLTATAN